MIGFILFIFACLGYQCIDVLPIRIYQNDQPYFKKFRSQILKRRLSHQPVWIQCVVFASLLFIPFFMVKSHPLFQFNYFLLFFFWVLVVLCWIDFLSELLPDILTIPTLMLGLGIQWNTFYHTVGIKDSLLGITLSLLFIYFSNRLFFLFKKKDGIGFGDIKLIAMIGAWLGYLLLPFILLIASLFFLLWMGCQFFLFKHKKLHYPFGPFIVLATLFIFYKI